MGLSNWATIISGFRQKFTISSNTDNSGISIINNLNGREVLTGQTTSTLNTGPSTPEMIQNNIASMVELAQANRIKVILCSVTPAFDYPWKPGLNPAEKIIALICDTKELHLCRLLDDDGRPTKRDEKRIVQLWSAPYIGRIQNNGADSAAGH
ncbi:hypothetical protein GCM10027051_34140 [Niabella terrae]